MNAIEWIRSTFRYLGMAALIAIAILSEVPGGFRPHVFAVTQLEHVAAYFAAALLLALGFWNARNILLLSLALPIYAGVLEVAQLFIPGRNSDLIDFLASTFGAYAGLISAWLLRLAWKIAQKEGMGSSPGHVSRRSTT